MISSLRISSSPSWGSSNFATLDLPELWRHRGKYTQVTDDLMGLNAVLDNNFPDYVATRWYRAPELLVGDPAYGKEVHCRI